MVAQGMAAPSPWTEMINVRLVRARGPRGCRTLSVTAGISGLFQKKFPSKLFSWQTFQTIVSCLRKLEGYVYFVLFASGSTNSITSQPSVSTNSITSQSSGSTDSVSSQQSVSTNSISSQPSLSTDKQSRSNQLR